MIKHVVLFKLNEKNDENLEQLKQALLSLKDKIDLLQGLEVGTNGPDSPRAMDLALITEFANWDDLNAYRTHPDHLPVVELVGQLCLESRVVDYEV